MSFLTRREAVFFFALVVFCIVVYSYSPILFAQFGYHNDYYLWDCNDPFGTLCFIETKHLIGIGRPILALLLNFQLSLIHSMGGIHAAQVVAVITIALIGVTLFLYIQHALRITLVGAAVLSILVMTLPSVAINSFWITNYVSGLFALLIAFSAYLLLQQRPSGFSWRKPATILACLLLFLDLMIYPPSTFFFLALTLLKLLFGPKQAETAELKSIIREVAIMVSLFLLYALVIRFLLRPFLLQHPLFLFEHLGSLGSHDGNSWVDYYTIVDQEYPEYSLTRPKNLLLKITQLKQFWSVLVSAWFPLLTWKWVVGLSAMTLAVLTAAAKSSVFLIKKHPLSRTGVLLTVFIGLEATTALPLLVAPSTYEVNYRTAFPAMILMPALIIFAAERLFIWLRGCSYQSLSDTTMSWVSKVYILFVAALILWAQMIALHRIDLLVERSEAEYKVIYNALSCQLQEGIKKIRLYLPLVPFQDNHYINMDFALNASNTKIMGLAKAALQSLGRNAEDFEIIYDTAHKRRGEAAISIGPVLKPCTFFNLDDIIGAWSVHGKPASIHKIHGAYYIVNEYQEEQPIPYNDHMIRLTIPGWKNIGAVLSERKNILYWDNGITWTRQH